MPLNKDRLGVLLMPVLFLLVLASICFARLIAHPSALIVDGERPSIDYANPVVQRPIGNDLTFLFLPHHIYLARSIAQTGHWPMWDPTGFGGRPMVGNPQSGMFYPPIWLVWKWGGPATLGWLTLLHLIWGGIGTYLLARITGVSRFGSTVAAGCFQASPYLLGHVFEGHYPHVWGVCWFPWAFWAFDSRRLRRRIGTVVLPPIMAIVYLVGHPQEGFLLAVALTFRTFIDWTRSQKHEGILARWCGILFISLGIAAIDLAPQLAIRGWKVPATSLSGGEPEIPSRYTLHLINMLQIVSPEALGGPADYDGYDNSWETMFAFGLATMVLAIAATWLYPDRQAVRSWVTLAILTVWIAWGYKLGLYAVMYHLVPGMKMFRVPSRPLFLTTLAMAMLAGMGIDALSLGQELAVRWRHLGRFLLTAAVPTIVLALGVAAWPRGVKPDQPLPYKTDNAPTVISDGQSRHSLVTERGWGRERRAIVRVASDPRVWALTFVISTIVAAGSLRSGRPHPKFAAWAIGSLALLELGYWGYSLLQVASPAQFLGPDPVARTLAQVKKSSTDQPPFRLKTRDAFYSDLRVILNGFEKTNIEDSFQLDHAAFLYEQLYPVASRNRPARPGSPLASASVQDRQALRQSIFDRMGVEFLVSDRVESDPPWPILEEGDWQEGARYAIQRNPSVLPRAYVVGQAQRAPSEPSEAVTLFRSTDPRTTVLLEVDPLKSVSNEPGDRQRFTTARWTSTDPDHPRLEVETDRPGYLVIADTWMPGWTAHVNGKPAEVLRGNVAQRVIPLPDPGSNRIELNYSPPGWHLGVALCFGSLAIWGLACRKLLRQTTVMLIPNHAASGPTIPA